MLISHLSILLPLLRPEQSPACSYQPHPLERSYAKRKEEKRKAKSKEEKRRYYFTLTTSSFCKKSNIPREIQGHVANVITLEKNRLKKSKRPSLVTPIFPPFEKGHKNQIQFILPSSLLSFKLIYESTLWPNYDLICQGFSKTCSLENWVVNENNSPRKLSIR